jgi:hypothetical protein
MIKYKLKCIDCQNTFDSWFSSSKDYEKLRKQKYLSCDICNSIKIEKTVMSPSVIMAKQKTGIESKNKRFKKIKKKILDYQNFIKNNFDYVGENFAHEARSIHYMNKKKSKCIYGLASKNEVKELTDEGINTEIIPWIEDNNN